MKRKGLIVLTLVLALVMGGMISAPSALANPGEYLLINPGDTASITGCVGGEAIFQFFNPGDPTGSGVFDPFVRINTNKPVEKGYNTSYRKLEFDENNSPTFTKDYLLADVPTVLLDDELYREFQCDINQKNSANPGFYLSLDELELYVTDVPKLHGYDGIDFAGQATLVWKMCPDDLVKINSLPNAGSGRRDFRVLIPAEDLVGGDYVVLFSQFGEVYPNNGGYEEWGVRVGVTPPPPDIDVEKYIKIDDGDWLDADNAPVSGDPNWLVPVNTPIFYKIVVSNTGGVELTDIELTEVWWWSMGDLDPYYDINDYDHPTALAPGESFIIEIGPLPITEICFHCNTVTAVGVYAYDNTTYQDVDSAWFEGGY